MNEEQREKRAAALKEAAKKRSDATEQAQVAEIKRVWEHISDEARRVFAYIEKEIPRREDSKDVSFLRETRELWFRPYRKYLKEVAS